MGKTPKEIRDVTPAAEPSDTSIVHVSEENNDSLGILQRDGARLATKIENYSDSRTYKVGDVARLLDAEDVICITAITTPEAYTFAKWRALRADIKTSVIKTSVKNTFITGVDCAIIKQSGTTNVFIQFNEPHNFATGDSINVVTDDPEFNVLDALITIIDAVDIEYQVPSEPTASSANGSVSNLKTIQIGDTKGFVVDDTDPEDIKLRPVDESAQGIQPGDFSQESNLIFMDANGVFLFTEAINDDPQQNREKMLLGFFTGDPSPNDIFIAKSAPDTIQQGDALFKEFFRNTGGAVFPSGGLDVLDAGTDLSIRVGACTVWYPGANYDNDNAKPDAVSFPDQFPVLATSFSKVYSTGNGINDGELVADGQNEIDVDQYNANGVDLEPVTGSDLFQIFRVYQSNIGTLVYYDYHLFATITEARDFLQTTPKNETPFEEKSFSLPGGFLGFIIARQGLTQWSDGERGTDFDVVQAPEQLNPFYRGIPTNVTVGQTEEERQAALANESTGMIDGGKISQTIRDIATTNIVSNTATVVTTESHNFGLLDRVLIEGTGTDLDGIVWAIAVVNTTTIQIDAALSDASTVGGVITNLERIDIEAGSAQISDHSVANETQLSIVEWDNDEGVKVADISGADMSAGANYITKNIDGNNEAISVDEESISQGTLRQKILLGVVKTWKGVTSSNFAETEIFSVTNQKIAIIAPRLQIDDYHSLFSTKSGMAVFESDPTTDYKIAINSGSVVGRGPNFNNNLENPNIISVGNQDPISFYIIDRNGFISDTPVTDLDNVNYDNNGTLTPIGNGDWQLQRLWLDPVTQTYYLQYGTQEYNNGQTNDKPWLAEQPPAPVGLSASAYIIASLLIREGESDWDGDFGQEIFRGDITSGSDESSGGGGSTGVNNPMTETLDGGLQSITNLLNIILSNSGDLALRFGGVNTMIQKVGDDIVTTYINTAKKIFQNVGGVKLAEIGSSEGLRMDVRVQAKHGADIASATQITLGNDGNAFDVTGTTTIDLMNSLDWQEGAVVTLYFHANITIQSNETPSGNFINFQLKDGVDFNAIAGDNLTVRLHDGSWDEISRLDNT